MSVRPTMFGSPPNRVCQVPYDTTATGDPLFGAASAAVNARPRTVLAPMIAKVSAVANIPLSRSGVSMPVRFTLMPRMIPMSSNDR